MEQTPMYFLRSSNLDTSKGIIKISANYLLVGMYSSTIVLSTTSSLMKWCRISMCLVQECWTGFFEILVALVLPL